MLNNDKVLLDKSLTPVVKGTNALQGLKINDNKWIPKRETNFLLDYRHYWINSRVIPESAIMIKIQAKKHQRWRNFFAVTISIY